MEWGGGGGEKLGTGGIDCVNVAVDWITDLHCIMVITYSTDAGLITRNI